MEEAVQHAVVDAKLDRRVLLLEESRQRPAVVL
jgi:hypothetical protein